MSNGRNDSTTLTNDFPYIILRHSDVVGIMPRPLLGHPETRGIVAIEDTPLRPCDIELLLLTQPDAPLTAAAEYFAHCLMTHSQPV